MFRRFFLIALTIGMSVIIGNIPPVGSQGLMVISKFVKWDISADPRSPVWGKVDSITVPLSSQIIANPRAFALPKGKSSVRWINVKSINNRKEIAFFMEWEDMTENSILDDTAVYRDAVALQFPVNVPEKGNENPYFGMGHEGMPVNIWQWKADLEGGGDISPKEKERKSPVEDLNAERFGTLTLQDSQDVMGKGVWSGGKWRVVFYRPMVTKDKDDAKFKKGSVLPIAFAVWDGSNLEKDGQKSISTWHELKIE